MSETILVGMISAAAAILGAITGSLLPLARDAWKNKQQARYLAIRIVCGLDRFLEDCASVVGDDGTEEGGELPPDGFKPQVSTPERLILPDDVDWRSIDHNLMYEILALPNRLENEKRAIIYTAQHADPIEYFEERQYRFSCLGLDVAALTLKLRSIYQIPKLEVEDWDPVTFLKSRRDEIENRRKDRNPSW